MKRRLTWNDVQPFPDNPIYPGRLDQMEREWNGYNHDIVGSPAIFDNSSGAFPDHPEDTLFIGDGNHRYELAKRHKQMDAEFVADLYRGLKHQEMYKRRRGLNSRRTVPPAEQFLSLVEENPLGKEAQIRDLVEGTGWKVGHRRGNGILACTNEIQWIYKRNPEALVKALQTYDAAWGRNKGDKADNGQAVVIKGLGAFWLRYPDAEFDRLVKALEASPVGEWYGAARNQRDVIPSLSTVYDAVRYVVALAYNKGLRRHGTGGRPRLSRGVLPV